MRISRPARATRATPWLPKRVSGVPSGLQPDHRAARRARRRSGRSRRRASCPPGPGRIAAAPMPAAWPGPERDARDPGARPARVEHAGRPDAHDRERRGIQAAAPPPTVKVSVPSRRTSSAVTRPVRFAAAPSKVPLVANVASGLPSASRRTTIGMSPGREPPRITLPLVSITIAPSSEPGRAGQHVAEARAEARVDLAGRQQPEGDEARRPVGRAQRAGGDDPAVAEDRDRAHAVERRAGQRRDDLAAGAEAWSPASRSSAAARRRTGPAAAPPASTRLPEMTLTAPPTASAAVAFSVTVPWRPKARSGSPARA